MKKRIVVLAVIGTVWLAGDAYAGGQTPAADLIARDYIDPADGVTADDAVRLALEREPALRASRGEVDVARSSRIQAGARPNPDLLLGYQDEPSGTDSQIRLEVEWPLALFRRSGRIAAADVAVEAAGRAVADDLRRLAAAVRVKYGEVAAAARQLAVMDALVAAVRTQHQLTAARVQQGAAPRIDRDVLSVELRRLEAEREREAGRASQAVIEFKRLIGLGPDAPLRIRSTIEDLLQGEPADAPAPAAAAGVRPDVQLAQSRIRLADARIAEAEGEGRFDVSLFGTYMRMDAGFPQSGFGPAGGIERVRGVFHYVSAGAMIAVPLFDRKEGAVAAARAERANASARAEAAELTARAEIASAESRLLHASRALAAYAAETRALARQNVDVVRQTYELGRGTVYEVLEEQRRYLDLERSFTEAMREAYDARQALRLARGDGR
jgi:cobalt-zinc-cadmium efflux system outer membrane protein